MLLFSADIVRSPRNIFIFIIYKNIFQVKVSKKTFYLFLKTQSLLMQAAINSTSGNRSNVGQRGQRSRSCTATTSLGPCTRTNRIHSTDTSTSTRSNCASPSTPEAESAGHCPVSACCERAPAATRYQSTSTKHFAARCAFPATSAAKEGCH